MGSPAAVAPAGLSGESWSIMKNMATELGIILIGYFTLVPAIQVRPMVLLLLLLLLGGWGEGYPSGMCPVVCAWSGGMYSAGLGTQARTCGAEVPRFSVHTESGLLSSLFLGPG